MGLLPLLLLAAAAIALMAPAAIATQAQDSEWPRACSPTASIHASMHGWLHSHAVERAGRHLTSYT